MFKLWDRVRIVKKDCVKNVLLMLVTGWRVKIAAKLK